MCCACCFLLRFSVVILAFGDGMGAFGGGYTRVD
jgi:hypothetical protein